MNELHAVPSTSPVFALSTVCCPRDHVRDVRCTYRVAWRINPHMRVGAVDPRDARSEHRALRAALLREGASVIELPFVHGAYDSVFVKDNALLLERAGRRRALLARPMHAVRRREQCVRAAAYDALGFEVVAPPRVLFEGGDVVMWPGARGAFVGCGPRSSRDVVPALERYLDAPVVPLALRDARLYHLDTAMTVLSDGTALLCREAFEPVSLRAIERAPCVQRVVCVPTDDALAFGLNVVEVGRAVLLARGAPSVCATLRTLGRRPVELPLDAFRAAGGSAACLVARVHGQAVEAPRALSA